MLGSVGSVVPKRWILGIFALGLVAAMVATSSSPWAGAATLPTSVTAVAASPTSIQVDWIAVDSGSTLPESGAVIDGYRVDCVPTGSGSTVSETVSGITAATATVTGLTASTEYICSVFASSNSTLPSSGVAASAVTTPATLAAQLGSVLVSPASAAIQVDGQQVFAATAKGADTAGTVITGLTVNWSISGNGSISATTGGSVTYTASAAGSATLTASVTQSSTGITKSTNVSITNFSPRATAVDEPVVDPTDPADIPTPPSLGGNTQAVTAVVLPSTGANLTVPAPASTNTDFLFPTTAEVNIPVGAVEAGTALAVVVELVPRSGGTSVAPSQVSQENFIPLPAGVTAVDSEPLTVQFLDSNGNEVKGLTFNKSVTITLGIPTGNVLDAGLDPQSIALFKASDPAVGPWTELTGAFNISGDSYRFIGVVKDFSTFKLGSRARDVASTAGPSAVLPSAGDLAPSTGQVIGLTAAGLALVAGGGVYLRRQRKASRAG